jgi:putative ABC transport system substrate-binding protein
MHRQLIARRQVIRGGLAMAGFGIVSGCSRLTVPQSPPAPKRLGFLTLTPEPYHEALFQGLRELGYVEGENLVVERRTVDGHTELIPRRVHELLNLGVDVLISAGIGTTITRMTSTRPIVMVIADAVEQGVVVNLAKPGANVTGINVSTPPLATKRLSLLQEAFPSMRQVAVVEAGGRTGSQGRALNEVAETLRLKLLHFDVLGTPDLFKPPNPSASFLERIRIPPVDGMIALDTPFIAFKRAEMIAHAAERRIPTIYPHRVFAEDGGLMSYGPDYTAIYRRLATFVDKILKGARPGEIPMEQPTTLDFVINLKTAQTLGLTMPSSILQQATQVVQ